MHTNHRITVFMLACFLAPSTLVAATIEPLVRVIDLDVGETHQITLHDGTKTTVTLLELIEKRDSVRNAVRKAQVKVKVNSRTAAKPMPGASLKTLAFASGPPARHGFALAHSSTR